VVSLLAPNASLDVNYPSTQVPLTTYQSTTSTANSTYYFRLSGTSMAAPKWRCSSADVTAGPFSRPTN
jgi:hypothetical protein